MSSSTLRFNRVDHNHDCPTCRGELFAHLADDGRVEFLCAGCTRFDLTPRDPAPCGPANADLPGPVQFMRRSVQDVFRVLRDLDRRLMPAEVIEVLERRTGDVVSRDNVNHALARLKNSGWVTHCPGRGWELTRR